MIARKVPCRRRLDARLVRGVAELADRVLLLVGMVRRLGGEERLAAHPAQELGLQAREHVGMLLGDVARLARVALDVEERPLLEAEVPALVLARHVDELEPRIARAALPAAAASIVSRL